MPRQINAGGGRSRENAPRPSSSFEEWPRANGNDYVRLSHVSGRGEEAAGSTNDEASFFTRSFLYSQVCSMLEIRFNIA